MQVIIPMSGAGSRFARAGYSRPKPLIPVDGRPMIEHVIGMFPGVTDFVFVCSRQHLESTNLESVLRRAAPTGRIVPIEPHKLGPVYATLQAEALIQNDERVMVNYCDFAVQWDFRHFCRSMDYLAPAGALTAYRGFHPHSLGPNLYAYMRHENNKLLEIAEKRCFTNDRMSEFASTGTYYFRSGSLLRRYFQAAMAHGLTTNGEYYASMPYNLMVADGLRVHIYEVERFLQWGTPEDLEEYQSWSNYFATAADWRPTRKVPRGAVLVPMAGDGARFAREGYIEPKPLVPVAEVPMVERALQTLPPSSHSVALCRGEHLRSSKPDGSCLRSTINRTRHGTRLIPVEHRTEGQACTCLLAESAIDPGDAVLVAPCDCSLIYDEAKLAPVLEADDADCVAFTFRNHPHANRNPQQYGWLVTDGTDVVEKVLCKTAPEGSIQRARGITGMFWFREAGLMFDAIRRLVARNRRVNGEFYLDSALGMLIEAGHSVRAFDVDHYICYGTPDDVRTYEYWASYFSKAPGHPFAKEEAKRHVAAGEQLLKLMALGGENALRQRSLETADQA